jgi:hypothetical protein
VASLLCPEPVFFGPTDAAGVIEYFMTLSLKSANRRKMKQNALKAYIGKEQVKPKVSRVRPATKKATDNVMDIDSAPKLATEISNLFE